MAKKRSTAVPLTKVVNFLDSIAPSQFAEPWDKTGLLSGPRGAFAVRRMLVALDLTPAIKQQCVADGINLLICYHPPIFKPLDRLCVKEDTPADLAVELAQEKIWIYSPHTALDVAAGGTNDALAAALNVSPCGSLILKRHAEGPEHLKLVVFVPESHVEQVAEAVFEAGAGQIGRESRYTQCSFRTPGTGTFFGDESTSPAVGNRGQLEFVQEIRFETIVPAALAGAVTAALRQAHPYEEPAYDLLMMHNEATEPGMGRIADVPEKPTLAALARRCKRKLGIKSMQVLGNLNRRISTVGILAGSCGHLPLECGKTVDCVITGELKHHDMLAFQAAGVAAILLGHAESEKPVLLALARQLAAAFPATSVQVAATHAAVYQVL
jgi:dinuclear metal center YbgI/SA1388 family protein